MLDVREIAAYHREAKVCLMNRQMVSLFHARLATADGESFEKEIDRLEGIREDAENEGRVIVPKTPEEHEAGRREFAQLLGLKPRPKVKEI
jgi:hypothetical protein